ncbi:MAG: type I asparaginase [Trueperaceae bacterium]
MSERGKVLLLHAGGTLGMLRGADGRWAPASGALARALAAMPERDDPDLPEITVAELDPLLDSAEMRPRDWQRIADTIRDRLPGHDGCVVVHGTDTMAYTASALSFLLTGLDRPVIVTGSQIPLVRARNDARENLIASLQLATDPHLAEVAIHLHGSLLRGNRATKVSASGFGAFESPNLPPLAEVGAQVRWNRQVLREKATGPLRSERLASVSVVALRLFPGIDGTVLRRVLDRPVRGLVLETYGTGNGPGRDADLTHALADATDRGVVITAVTQCLRGGTDMEAYAAAAPLLQAGVVPGGDMTAEAALAKLLFLTSQHEEAEPVRAGMLADLRGERTVRTAEDPGP